MKPALVVLLFVVLGVFLISYAQSYTLPAAMQNAPDGTVIDSGLTYEGRKLHLVKLSQANILKQKQQAFAQYKKVRGFSPLNDIDVPGDFMNNRFPSDYAPPLLSYLNSQGQQYQGRTVNFIQAEILGFPPTPIPTSGHVTHDFMTQMGGLNVTLEGIQWSSLTPFLNPYGYNSALFINDADTTQQHQNAYSQQVTDTYSVSYTVGITLGYSESITAGVPSVESSTTTFSMQLSFSTTTTDTATKQDTATDTTTVNVAPRSVVNITCFVNVGHLTTNFTAELTLSSDSNVGWVFQDDYFYPPGQAWFWFFQTYQTIDGMRQIGQSFANSLSYDYVSTGVFNGVAGNQVQCSIYQCPYSPGVTQCIGNSTNIVN
jgi:hypothetical protein